MIMTMIVMSVCFQLSHLNDPISFCLGYHIPSGTYPAVNQQGYNQGYQPMPNQQVPMPGQVSVPGQAPMQQQHNQHQPVISQPQQPVTQSQPMATHQQIPNQQPIPGHPQNPMQQPPPNQQVPGVYNPYNMQGEF